MVKWKYKTVKILLKKRNENILTTRLPLKFNLSNDLIKIIYRYIVECFSPE